ncbi:hypothetical protein [Hwanghaeella sp.]|uniref:hypothetical protein n=1 Tax=Hwanghaeella sp. TaxID=2605943 RepID=UPI003CCC0B03
MPRSKKAELIRETEQETLSRTPGNLTEARRTFREELSYADQLRLAEEIVLTRGQELCLAYANVISLTFGFARKRSKSDPAKKILRRDVSVSFIVKRKWGEGQAVKGQELPKYLFAFWKVGRKRKLCAVPTDVEAADDVMQAEPLSAKSTALVSDPAGQIGVTGAITCVIKRKKRPLPYAISCRHVLSMSDVRHGKPGGGNPVSIYRGGGGALAVSTGIRGPLSGNRRSYSLDVQLAGILDGKEDAFRQTMLDLEITDYVRSNADIPRRFDIYRPPTRHDGESQRRSERVTADLVRFHYNRLLPYHQSIGRILHELLLEVRASPRTMKGDSGSPAITTDKTKLVGMLIAGQGDLSYLIPAWYLLNPVQYGPGRERERWKLLYV